MKSPELEDKRIFIVAAASLEIGDFCEKTIKKHVSKATVFRAGDGQEALFKAENTVPHVVIIGPNLGKIKGVELTQALLAQKNHKTSVILISQIPEDQVFVDEVVTGQVQFLRDYEDDAQFDRAIVRALNHVSLDDNSTYRLKFMTPGEKLFSEEDMAESLFFVKKGEMKAEKKSSKGERELGKILSGEFVGEMAHFNKEPRSATVHATTDCELIEIPFGTLDMVLFSKPAWARALVATLAKRLKQSNEAIVR